MSWQSPTRATPRATRGGARSPVTTGPGARAHARRGARPRHALQHHGDRSRLQLGWEHARSATGWVDLLALPPQNATLAVDSAVGKIYTGMVIIAQRWVRRHRAGPGPRENLPVVLAACRARTCVTSSSSGWQPSQRADQCGGQSGAILSPPGKGSGKRRAGGVEYLET
jgi:hypothetical protein